MVFSDTQINEDEYVRFIKAEYKDIRNEELPDYKEEEAPQWGKVIEMHHTSGVRANLQRKYSLI